MPVPNEGSRKPRNGAPFLFTLAASLMRRRVRGSSKLLKLTETIGLLARPVRYRVEGGLHIDVPISRPDNTWDQTAISTYEARPIAEFTSRARRLPPPITYIDCGADIGLFALRVAALVKLSRVFAIEPDTEAFHWLKANLEQLNGEALHCAAANFTGNGRLEFPDYDPASPHSQYLVPDNNGPVRVVRLDDLAAGDGSLAIKIDVEGAELEVLRGAVETIRRSQDAVILFEAHADVIKRTRINPIECMRLLASIRPFQFIVAETGDRPSAEQDFEVPHGQIYNIVASTTNSR